MNNKCAKLQVQREKHSLRMEKYQLEQVLLAKRFELVEVKVKLEAVKIEIIDGKILVLQATDRLEQFERQAQLKQNEASEILLKKRWYELQAELKSLKEHSISPSSNSNNEEKAQDEFVDNTEVFYQKQPLLLTHEAAVVEPTVIDADYEKFYQPQYFQNQTLRLTHKEAEPTTTNAIEDISEEPLETLTGRPLSETHYIKDDGQGQEKVESIEEIFQNIRNIIECRAVKPRILTEEERWWNRLNVRFQDNEQQELFDIAFQKQVDIAFQKQVAADKVDDTKEIEFLSVKKVKEWAELKTFSIVDAIHENGYDYERTCQYLTAVALYYIRQDKKARKPIEAQIHDAIRKVVSMKYPDEIEWIEIGDIQVKSQESPEFLLTSNVGDVGIAYSVYIGPNGYLNCLKCVHHNVEPPTEVVVKQDKKVSKLDLTKIAKTLTTSIDNPNEECRYFVEFLSAKKATEWDSGGVKGWYLTSLSEKEKKVFLGANAKQALEMLTVLKEKENQQKK
jgi:hypothetical protein